MGGAAQLAVSAASETLAVGIRDVKLLRHAGEIALKAGDPMGAERYLQQAVSLNTLGSDQARTLLASFTQDARR